MLQSTELQRVGHNLVNEQQVWRLEIQSVGKVDPFGSFAGNSVPCLYLSFW